MTIGKEASWTNSSGLCEKLIMDWGAIAPEKDRQQANVFINILKSYRGLEQQYRIMLEAVKLLPFYEYKKEPRMPTYVFENYHSRKEEVNALPPDKRTEFFKKLYLNKEASEYFRAVDDIAAQNLSNALWLEEMIKVMKQAHDEHEIAKVIRVYNRYPNVMGSWKRKVVPE
jgi:hypothetical protein